MPVSPISATYRFLVSTSIGCGLTDLRELELRYHAQDVMPTLSDFRSMLCASPGLERLVIVGWGPRMDGDGIPGRDDPHTIDLPRLEELEIGFIDVTYAINLLSLFVLPSLRVLSIEDVVFGIQPSEPRDRSLLLDHLVDMNATDQVSLSRLDELTLRCLYAETTSIRSVFNHLRALTSLCLNRVDAMALLATCSALCGACDQLRTLTLKDVDATTVALVLWSVSFPPHVRIFLDIEENQDDSEEVGDFA
ncbi:hypothetical protein JVU11DRAFT_11976 [Chiua virens]|nr:hypothetical protein JVU11DRAFT_11976 [Chiua virens]